MNDGRESTEGFVAGEQDDGFLLRVFYAPGSNLSGTCASVSEEKRV
jgi:hypothetical protein